ncbi:hypothetical protein KXV74_008784 [Aspergillus fumigatus]|uniref:Uncharacterized protein n=1 Tax=Aspergillus fumigatus TaxID=746128 RepID=A0A9P8STF2_ASPFM|nr:hypothetical protein KXX48_008441 [Aspergillus fumigatus]KAH1378126.1 hypothetical protein KXX10_009280 [Aspergillus fumigatus]KAH1539759.1 hypothetical protein KXX61_006753 [Aspergillus fumigatus]KAH1578110.1 hypothetical protein KXX17_006856 [Aspergillus fumigatus]KAH1622923.1 hypothetical protein KXX31_003890 [Aspergillus fumigatus]
MAGAVGTWAIALSDDGQYLAGVTQDGHIRVWDLNTSGELIRDYETKGSFGTCLDMSVDGRLIASGHENGSVYIFSTETGRMPFSLSGLVKPVRTVAFSPGGKLLAAAGDSRVIVLYDTSSGEQVANLSAHLTGKLKSGPLIQGRAWQLIQKRRRRFGAPNGYQRLGGLKDLLLLEQAEA